MSAAWQRRVSPFGVLIALGVANHVVLTGSRVAVSLNALALGANAATVGALMALFALLPMFFAIPAGRLADRLGVRKPMLAGSIGMMASVVMVTLLPGLPALFATAVLIGVSFMLFQVAVQYATGEMGGPGARTRNFGLLALGLSTSSIAGPLIAGFMIDHAGYHATFALLALFPLIPIAVLGTNRIPLPGPHPAHAMHPQSSAFDLVAHRELRRVFIINGLTSMAWELHTLFVPIYGHAIGLSAFRIGLILAAFAAATFVVRLAMPAIARRVSRARRVDLRALHRRDRLSRVSLFAQRRHADDAVVLPRAGAWRQPADGDVAAAQPRAPGTHGRGRRRAHVACQLDGRRRAAGVRRGGRIGRSFARAVVGWRIPRHRRLAYARPQVAGQRALASSLRLRRSANVLRNFATFGATTYVQYGCPPLCAK